MVNHTVSEPDSVYDNLDNYNVGDIVEYISNNQEGYAEYVVEMNDGEKSLRQIGDLYGRFDGNDDDNYDDENEDEAYGSQEGGKKRKVKRARKTLKKTKGKRMKKHTAHKKRTLRKKVIKKRGASTRAKGRKGRKNHKTRKHLRK